MTEQETEDSFTLTLNTPGQKAVFAEMLARKPDDASLRDWVSLLGVVVDAFLDHRLVWYWDLDRAGWVPGRIVDGGLKVGSRGFDVDLFYGGPLRWAEEWQVLPCSSTTEPAPPDLSKVAP